MTKLTPLTDATFQSALESAQNGVIVNFRADWCGPCKMIAPNLEELAAEYQDTIRFYDVDVDTNTEMAASLGIRAIPAIFAFFDGKPVGSKAGAAPKAALAQFIQDSLPARLFDKEAKDNSNLIAIEIEEGRLRVVELNSDGSYRFASGLQSARGIFTPRFIDSNRLLQVIEEFEHLINDPSMKEQDFQTFFETHPQFILQDSHAKAHSKVVLSSQADRTLIPDFVLEPSDPGGLCDLLEIKRPDAKIATLQKNRERFSSAVFEAVTQLREYADYFDQDSHQERIEEQYGLCFFRPKMFLVIGRRGDLSQRQFRTFEGAFPDVSIRTYDDVLDLMKRRFGLE